ncbi:hypothetical protein [Arcanobacterium phocae]|uniref:hypothetical protein n=2 Tax=Arcanobacterium phocae TaxID=131112 RepID=UPI001C0F34CC|nr:hypothetical protein [Arcanobacterium phocae]
MKIEEGSQLMKIFLAFVMFFSGLAAFVFAVLYAFDVIETGLPGYLSLLVFCVAYLVDSKRKAKVGASSV